MSEQLPPGAALDAEIAKVMGWTVDKLPAGDYWIERGRRGFVVNRSTGDRATCDSWNPSQNWAHLRWVIDEMVKRGYEVKIYAQSVASCMVVIAPAIGERCTGKAIVSTIMDNTPTLPHAVCLATLKAVKHEPVVDGPGMEESRV